MNQNKDVAKQQSGFDENVLQDDSPLKLKRRKNLQDVRSEFEGIPAELIKFGSFKMGRSSFRGSEDGAGMWMGRDSDGLFKVNFGDVNGPNCGWSGSSWYFGNNPIGSHMNPTTNNSYSIGSSSKRWYTIYLTNAPDVSSDRKTKRDIKSLNKGLSSVLVMKPYSFKRMSGEKTYYGFMAQDMNLILPDISTKVSIRYEEIIPVLVNAIKELNDKIENRGFIKSIVRVLKTWLR
jgi:hypothetical protein